MSVLPVCNRAIEMLTAETPWAPTPVSAKLDSQEMGKLVQVINDSIAPLILIV